MEVVRGQAVQAESSSGNWLDQSTPRCKELAIGVEYRGGSSRRPLVVPGRTGRLGNILSGPAISMMSERVTAVDRDDPASYGRLRNGSMSAVNFSDIYERGRGDEYSLESGLVTLSARRTVQAGLRCGRILFQSACGTKDCSESSQRAHWRALGNVQR